MKISLDKIETNTKINGLGLKRTIDCKHYQEMYFDTDLRLFIVIRHEADSLDSKFSGRILIPGSSVSCAQVSSESVPTHQPIGTNPEHDTKSGHRKPRRMTTSKKVIAERIEARKTPPPDTDQ